MTPQQHSTSGSGASPRELYNAGEISFQEMLSQLDSMEGVATGEDRPSHEEATAGSDVPSVSSDGDSQQTMLLVGLVLAAGAAYIAGSR